MFLGNQQIKDYFEKLIKSEALNHAYLFHGPEGVGKKLLALQISESLLGPAYQNTDLKLIDKSGEEIHIADVRELKNFIHLTPFGKYKIAILNNAHNLGRDASNALLKILEEPPRDSIFFLISHLPEAVLPTVASRCQKIRFKPLKKEQVFNHLINQQKIKRNEAEICSKISNGSLGLALELANNFDGFQKNVNLLNRLIKAGFRERFDEAKKISASPEDLRKAAGDWFVYSASLTDKKLAKEILYLNNILSRPQFNHRLALENFLVHL